MKLPGSTLFLVWLLTTTIWGAPDPEMVRSVTSQLICVCGCSNMIVASCDCTKAAEMTSEVAVYLESGKDPKQVLAAFKETYGSWVLAAPEAKGFNILAWILPFVGLAVGTFIVASALRRLKPGSYDSPTESEARPMIDERYRSLLEKETQT